MPTWFELYKFVKDPYEKLDPYTIKEEYLVWDRPDLSKAREKLDRFIEDSLNNKRVGLRIFGPSGSGKTWFTRIIEKELSIKDDKILFLYTKIPRIEPTFQIVYRIAIDYFIKHHFKKLTEITGATDLDSWKKVIGEPELSVCFLKLSTGTTTEKAIAKKWLIGDKITTKELSELEITYSLDSDYERFEMLRKLIEKLSRVFSTSILVVDELENASVKLAGQLSDSLRDMLDVFSERFGLIASFTAQKADEWYDLGYTEALGRRFDYTIKLDSLEKNTLLEFLSLHHKAYRKKESKVKDHIFPFTKDSPIKLLESTSPGYHYPGYFLPNCRDIVRYAAENVKEEIDITFIEENLERVTFK